MREIIINNNDAGQRIDKFIKKTYPSFPFSLMYKLIRKKQITVNRKRIKENHLLAEGDRVLIFAPEEAFCGKSQEDFVGLKREFDIAYEDENIIIADKKAGMLVHSDNGSDNNTLINQIKAYLYSAGEYRPDDENSFVPSLCNRIDRNTSGLVIAAKNARALREMNHIIKERLIDKTYLAAIHGIPENKSGEIKVFIKKQESTNTVSVTDAKTQGAKTAITAYRTVSVSRDRKLSLVEIDLLTGRTHQIRASFAHIGHPLLGDGKYAVNKADRERGFNHQALHCVSLHFGNCRDCELLDYLTSKTVYSKAKPDFLKLF